VPNSQDIVSFVHVVVNLVSISQTHTLFNQAVKLTINKLANHYIVLGLGALIPAIAILLVLRSSNALLQRYGKQTMVFLLIQLSFGIVWMITGVSRRLRTIEILEQAGPLCREVALPGSVPPKGVFTYQAQQIKRMLDTKTTMVDVSEGLSDRLLHQCFPEVTGCSPVLQDAARLSFLRAFTSAVTCCLFLLALFSAFLGLYVNHENTAIEWTALTSFYILFVQGAIKGHNLNPTRLAAYIAGIVFLPALISSLFGANLPRLDNWIFVCLAICAVLPGIQLWAFFGLLRARLKLLRKQCNTTTRSMRLKGTIIPEAAYKHFVAALKRETSSTSRCYQDDRHGVGSVASDRAGHMTSETLLESDPAFAATVPLVAEPWGWVGVTVALAGFALMYASINPSVLRVNLSLAALTMVIYGVRILHTAEFFSSECLFTSTVTSFSLDGTFTTARSAVASQGPNQAKMKEESPNVDLTIKVTSANFMSSIFAKPGRALPFKDLPRYVLAFDENEQFADAVFAATADDISKQNTLGEINITYTGPALTESKHQALEPPRNSTEQLESPNGG